MNINSLLQCINVMHGCFNQVCPTTNFKEAHEFFMAYDRAYKILLKEVYREKLEEEEHRADELIRQVFRQLGNNVAIC